LEVKERQRQQEEEKKSFLEKQHEDKDHEDPDQTVNSSVLPSSRKWDEIKPKPFRT
jgi:hypothetical protein